MKSKIATLGFLVFALSAMTVAQGGPPQGGPGGGFGGPGMMGGREGPGGGNEISLLNRKDVQDDLQLTAEQKTKLAELIKKYQPQRGGPGGGGPGGGGPGGGGQGGPPRGGGGQGGPPGGGDFDPEAMRAQMEKRQAEQKKALATVLTEAQIKRLGEIKIQMQGNAAVMDPEVQKKLGITEDQKDRIEVAMDDARENMRPPQGDPGERPDFQAMQAQMKKMQEQMNSAIGSVLTADQKTKLKEMGGKPFKRVDPQPGQGRPGGGGN